MNLLILFISSELWLLVLAITIECEYKQVEHFKDTGIEKTIYTCEANILQFGLDESKVTQVSEGHIETFANQDVKMISIDNQPYNKIPQGIEKFFPNLQGISVKDCKVENITKADLEPFPNLKYLIVSANFLEVLESHLFNSTLDLVLIDFSWNRLRHVGLDILNNLDKLKAAFFNSNDCIDEDYTHGKRKELEKLKEDLATLCKPTTWMIRRERLRALSDDSAQNSSLVPS
jgi:hypothetical protein